MTGNLTFNPTPALRPFVAKYIITQLPKQAYPGLIPPNLSSGLCFGLKRGDYFSISSKNKFHSDIPKSFVLPVHKQSYRLNYSGSYSAIAVHFWPGMFFEFFGWPQDLFSDQKDAVSLRDTDLGKEIKLIEEQIQETVSYHYQIALIETFLLKHLPDKPVFQSPIEFILTEIFKKKGQIKVENLYNQSNLSERHFRRKFRCHTGLSVQTFLRIFRFYQGFAQLNSGRFQSLMDIAIEAGYFDQAHFIRDFKNYIGFSPRQFLQKQTDMVREMAWGSNAQD